ncbi:MAG: DUF2339 domain-containing protein [Phycisphaerales bacterium]|jgi:hypothetical protein|nr:DUF2339 domain-containing protein [Phycisphaeraceae bacterium]
MTMPQDSNQSPGSGPSPAPATAADPRVDALISRLDGLESEVVRIRTHLRLPALAKPPAAAPTLGPIPAPAPAATAQPLTPTKDFLRDLAQRRSAAHTSRQSDPAASADAPRPAATTPGSTPDTAPVTRAAQVTTDEPPSTAPDERSLIEQIVGGRVLAVLGGLTIVLAMTLFLIMAYDRGWIGNIPGEVRCLGIALLGTAFCFLSVVARRRNAPWPAVGLGAAGIAGLYAAAYAAHTTFQILPPAAAPYSLLALLIGGVYFSWRQQLGTLAVVTVIASTIAPLLIRAPEGTAFAFPTQMLVLCATMLILTVLDRSRFSAAASLAITLTMLLGWPWGFEHRSTHPLLVIIFAGTLWMITHATLAYLSRPQAAPPADPEAETGTTTPTRAARSISHLGAMGVTAWTVALSMMVLDHSALAPTLLAPLALTVASLALALAFAPIGQTLTRAPVSAAQRFATLMLIQTGALIILCIADATHGPAAYFAWTVLGVAATLAALRLRSTGLLVYAGSVLVLATIRLALLVATGVFDTDPTPLLLGVNIAPAIAQASIVAAAWLLAAYAAASLLRPTQTSGPLGTPIPASMLTLIAHATLLTAALVQQRTAAGVAITIMLAAGLATLLGALLRPFRVHSLAFAAFFAAMIIGLLGMLPSWSSHLSPNQSLLHPAVAMLALFAAGMYTLRALSDAAPPNDRPGVVAQSAGAITPMIAFFTWAVSSFEVARLVSDLTRDQTTQSVTVSIWWAAFATALVVFGFLRERPAARLLGLGLLMLAGGKLVTYDLASANPTWRIIALFIVGLLMLAVATAYARFSRLSRERAATP